MSEYAGADRRKTGDGELLWISKQISDLQEVMRQSHTERRGWESHHEDVYHRRTEDWLKEHETVLKEHTEEIARTKTLFGVIAWASGAAWTGLLTWMGWGHK